MSEFLQRAKTEIADRNLFPRGSKILVAVSGGVDSMVLLHLLNRLAPESRSKISVAHFNHQLRGRASYGDEKLVRRIAKKFKLPFFVGCADVRNFSERAKISVEMAARKLRHEFFARVAAEQKISIIALAHHADDQVELFFLRLLRGAGGEGLAGMKWSSPSPADKKIALIRPLLGFSKDEILEFAREHKIPFRDDATNFSGDFLRNRIRNELLPLLQKKYQPGLRKTVLRLMEITGAEAEFVGEMAKARQTKIGSRNAKSETVADNFEFLPRALRRKILQQQLVAAGVVADFELIEQLRKSAGKFVSVGAEFSVARDVTGKIELRRQTTMEFDPEEFNSKLSGRAGQIVFGGKKFDWSKKGGQSSRENAPRQTEFFDADKIGGEIVLRHWRAGDRFQPIGLKSAAKLQDLFGNAKIPAQRRRSLVLAATANGEIFWVEGLRIGEGFKLTAGTRRQLAWNWSNLNA